MKNILSSVPMFDNSDFSEYIEGSRNIFNSGKYILGEYTLKLEKEFQHYTKAKYVIATSSATASLEIILKYIDVKDREVIVPANTFISTLYALDNSKGRPVVVDIDPNTYCISLEDTIANINSKTKAVIITHLAGYIPSYITQLKEICDKNDIFLIEDCAHATGAKYDNTSAGMFGFAGVFSLYQSKVVSSGTGGLIVTNDKNLYEYSQLMRAHGVKESNNIHLSSNWLLSEFNALVAYLQMCRIDEIINKRMKIAQYYIEELSNLNGNFSFQEITNSHIHPYYKFIVKYKDKEKIDYISQKLKNRGIQTGKCYPILLNEHSSLQNRNISKIECAKSREFAETHFTLPLNLTLHDKDYNYIIDSIKEIIKE